ncbi:kelch-like protein 21 [Plakobranchus ocellatus]|uniref:Kelch-like protein 21 n=1 Tax=Plakobranchus ocellatus TaxID=259542 RepID=A0AAV3ZHJ2_9GAST|nr:kelch-like protein 21 [Plakobranchus ocellatus]
MDKPLSDADTRVRKGIFEGLNNQKDNEEFHDIVVVAGSSEFKCHRLILASVSGFFRGLLRSETLSVENCIDYCLRLRLLNEDSKRDALTLLAKNFERFRYSERLFKLNFEEIKYLVLSEKLAACCEDDVIETILRWAESTPTLGIFSDSMRLKRVPFVAIEDEVASLKSQSVEYEKAEGETVTQDSEEILVSRSERLAELLECSRYLLTSYSFLVQTLSCHPLVKSNARCLALVVKISCYLSNTGLHQEWCPPQAIHRNSEEVKNVFLMYDRNGRANVISLSDGPCYGIKGAYMNLNKNYLMTPIFYQGGSLITFDSDNSVLLHIPVTNGWNIKRFATSWEHKKTISIGQSLYSFEKNTHAKATIMHKLRLPDTINLHTHLCQWQLVCQLSVKGLSLKATTSIGTKVIVFWAGESSEGFTVECFDLFQRKSTIMRDRMGSTADLVTFRRDNEVFALQTNGVLWRISVYSSSDQLEFTKEHQLWEGNVPLHGAFLYGTRLFILGDSVIDMPYLSEVFIRGVFGTIVFFNFKFCKYFLAALSKNLLELTNNEISS